jgi:hypothetical protein
MLVVSSQSAVTHEKSSDLAVIDCVVAPTLRRLIGQRKSCEGGAGLPHSGVLSSPPIFASKLLQDSKSCSRKKNLMAKKKSRKSATKKKSAPARATDGIVRICFERILPDEVDPERAIRRTWREHITASAGRRITRSEVIDIARMALVNSKKWPNGSTLKCRFLDGSSTMRKKVEEVAHRWEDHANLKFKFVSSGSAEIRISFYADSGSWSAVGRDALNQAYFPLHQPTMNYGWLRDDTGATECSRVVLHEVGHAIGCIHEHSNPNFDRKWDKQAVMTYFQGPPNYWTPQDIEHNVLNKYSPNTTSATRYDPDSIMLYSFDGALFSDGKGPTNSNTKLSPTDIAMIEKMYP